MHQRSVTTSAPSMQLTKSYVSVKFQLHQSLTCAHVRMHTSTTMSEYKYHPLPSSRHIRILQIWPKPNLDQLDDFLLCDLQVEDIELAAQQGYDALSYSWEGNPTAVISCLGKTLRVTENAKKALLQLRPSFGFRRVWIDAVCIKQQAFEYVAAKQQGASRSHGAPFSLPSQGVASHGGGYDPPWAGGGVLPYTPASAYLDDDNTNPDPETERNEMKDAINEMNHQLALMCEIYKRARKVIIWVGDTNKEVVEVFRILIRPGLYCSSTDHLPRWS